MYKQTLLALFLMLSMLFTNCTSEKEPVPDDCSTPPGLSLVSSRNANCNQSNGSVTLAGTGGSGSLVYSVNGSANQASPVFTGLRAGTYAATVSDSNGCSSKIEVTVLNSDGMNIDIITVGTQCGENEGMITVTAIGAQGAAEYRLNEGSFQSSNQFNDLAQGGYTITVRDESGCEVVQEADIKTNVSFAEIQLIIQNDCITSGCHDGAQTPDYRGMNNIIGNADLIKLRTSNGSMPPDGRVITDAQIAAIACWVDDGAQGN